MVSLVCAMSEPSQNHKSQKQTIQNQYRNQNETRYLIMKLYLPSIILFVLQATARVATIPPSAEKRLVKHPIIWYVCKKGCRDMLSD